MRKTRLFLFLAILLCCSNTVVAKILVDGINYTFDDTYNTAKVASGTYSGSITIPGTVDYNQKTYTVTAVEASAFSGLSNLSSVTLPNTITTINSSAFKGCTGLTSVTLPTNSDFTTIPGNCFESCTSLTSITIPNNVTSIGTYAFWKCTSLSSVTFPTNSSFTIIPAHCFDGCTSLASITIPNYVTALNPSAFTGCTGLTSVTIPNSVARINFQVFYSCTGLTSVTLPNSIVYIEDQAFASCSNLATINSLIESPSEVVPTGGTPFSNISSNAILNIPLGTRSAYSSAVRLDWAFPGTVQERAVITIPASGYVTYCSTGALNFTTTEATGLTAYVASSYTSTGSEAGSLTVTAHNNLPASTGMLLKGTAGATYALPEYAGTTDEVGTNMLVGTNANTTIGTTSTVGSNTYTNLILTTVDGTTGFYSFNTGGTMPAHKAYLRLLQSDYEATGGSSKKITINFEKGGTTDIKTVELNTDLENTIYNLQGQRVQNPEHGIYIVKGKKTYIK